MKKLLLFSLFFLLIPQTFGYNPTPKDEILLDKVYQKIDTIGKKDLSKVTELGTKLYTLKEKIKKKEKEYYLIGKIYEYIQTNYSTNSYKLLKVLDGDTISIEYNGEERKVRLIGINAPETKDVSFNTDCLGADATSFLKDTLQDVTHIALELDRSQGKTDSFGRLLGYVFVGGENINKLMIDQGYAVEYTYNKPYKYQSEFKKSYEEAQSKGIGIHSDLCKESGKTTSTGATIPTSADVPVQSYSFYTSSHHTSRLYYCETDTSWEGLSKTYLRNYPSEEELLKVYPSKTLNKPCN